MNYVRSRKEVQSQGSTNSISDDAIMICLIFITQVSPHRLNKSSVFLVFMLGCSTHGFKKLKIGPNVSFLAGECSKLNCKRSQTSTQFPRLQLKKSFL